jgi:hypothetical protein
MQQQGVEIIPINKDFQITVSPSPIYVPENILEIVEGIWQSDTRESGSQLFDGKILCATEVSATGLLACTMPYRFFYAQRQSEIVRDALQIKAVAVSGLIFHHDKLYFGRRSLSVTQYPDFVELVPSGSLDANLSVSNGKADFRRQLVEELTEEIGIDEVSDIEPLFLILDYLENTWDICCRITLLPGVIVSTGRGVNSKEYQEIIAVSLSELTGFLKTNKGYLVLTTQIILQELFSSSLSNATLSSANKE